VAIGSKAEEAKRFRVPLGHGIAGIVAASGQAMALADATNDPRLASDIADSVGYRPKTVLCVPLFYGDNIIGALELLDKEGGTFTAGDLEALGLFARQAAVALQLSRMYQNIAQILGSTTDEQPERGAPEPSEEDLGSRDALELANLVHEIAQQGEAERKACLALLEGFAEYLRTRSEPFDGLTTSIR